MNRLFRFLSSHWDRTSPFVDKGKDYPIIDYAMRVQRLPDGTFHVYIHPASEGGDTPDFLVTPENLFAVRSTYKGWSVIE